MAGRNQCALRSLSDDEASALAPQMAYESHALHHPERDWPQTNCYVDLWIELLASRGLDPHAMLGFTVAQDFEGDQFTFFKPRIADLEQLYGVRLEELSLYDRLDAQIERQVARGRVVLVEVDGHHLPDTRGVTYRIDHSKTTIGIDAIDLRARRLDYFHNDGFFSLDGEDFDAIFGLAGAKREAAELFPYAEFVRFDRAEARHDLRRMAEELLVEHFARRPAKNPLRAFSAELPALWETLLARPPCFFHSLAFNSFRQIGANFELLGSHLDWLRPNGSLKAESDACKRLSSGAKALQFQAARASSRKRVLEAGPALDELARVYDALIDGLAKRLAR
ncbi:DUF1839 family protein [Methylosinus trichosporium]|uniref:DUF1839 domain-containing protein n=2 Tax=Methylosinus TaxID=425 RepID=A0A2D2CW38_METT3|nr:DUF1839 domain-containing protein [Methylosinus trichosporium OB3b]OBS54054.1 serine--tRNA ligase [Methylosinus sp. 3S-1]